MAKFVDINSLTEKTLDGSESVQVSDTQKSKLVNILTQLGKNLQMAVPDKDRQTFPALGTTGKVQAWLSALAYACGIREISDSEQDTFRFLHGDNGDASVFGVVFWDRVNAVKVAVLFADYGIGADSGNTFPFAIYEGGQKASAIQADITDGAFITEITESGKWTRMFKVNSELLGVTPFDQLTSVSSLTVKAGDNIRASASTLSVLVGGANVFSQNNEYMRDAVIVANYDATVSFTAKDSSVVVRKSADVGTVTATSGKKVYTLHWAPAALRGGKVSNWEVFVNVAVYA